MIHVHYVIKVFVLLYNSFTAIMNTLNLVCHINFMIPHLLHQDKRTAPGLGRLWPR